MMIQRAYRLPAVTGTAMIAVLVVVSQRDYLIFHSFVETFSSIVAISVFVISLNAWYLHRNDLFMALGVSQLIMGVVDIFHMLSFTGMGVFPVQGSNWAASLWIISRYSLMLSLLAAVLMMQKKLSFRPIWGWIAGGLSALMVVQVMTGLFPVCYIEGSGQTAFKRISEYVITAGFLITLLLVFRKKEVFPRAIRRWMMVYLLLNILSEICFSRYFLVMDNLNMTGHLFKFAATMALYFAAVRITLRAPLDTLFCNLDTTNRMLAERNIQMASFSSMMSHDLRAPVRTISSFSAILEEDFRDSLPEEAQAHLVRIRNASERLGKMIDGLLDLSRLSRESFRPAPVDISRMAEDILKNLARSESSRQVQWSVQPGMADVADPQLLGRVLENLIGNAWKYTSHREAAVIEAGAVRHDGGTEYFVRDNGAGFDMRYAERLFQPFQRMHHASEFSGTGVGLASVLQIVRMHGGEVRAEAEEGRGATFWFTLKAVHKK